MTDRVTIRPARPGESGPLTDLCLRSKAVWGYSPEFMAACRAELTVTEAAIAAPGLHVAAVEGCLAGMVEVSVHDDTAELEKLFVDPAHLRAGIGTLLLRWAIQRACGQGARTMTIDADPDAAAFYRRLGAADAGTAASLSIPGRMLPRLRLAL